MRKFCVNIFFILLVIFLCPRDIFAQTIGKINSPNVNLRAAPTIVSGVLKNLSTGQAVEIFDLKSDFYKVSVDKINGYVSKQLIDIVSTDGLVNAENVNIRVLPYEDAQIISRASIGDKFEINALVGDWFVVSYNNGKAYIAEKFVVCNFSDDLQKINMPEHKFAIVTSDNGLNLREGKSVDAAAVCSLPCNCVLDVIDEKISDWVKVAFENNLGYVNSNYIKIIEGEKPSLVSSKAQQIISYAKKFIGTPYRYSGRDLNKGVDCSGFVYCIMKNFGVNLNSSSKTQVKNGIEVVKSNLLPGDLVFFSNNGAKDVQHVGIYIGNGQFIHSASPNNKGVIISGMSENYYTANYVTARRVL